MYAAPARVLVVDDSLPKRLATELTRRGRTAYSVSALGLRGSLDSDLIPELIRRFGDPVLITADDHMPGDHADVIAAHSPTIATIEPQREDAADDSYEREIVHRWVHVMHEQTQGSVMRYRLARPLRWRQRRR